jgi:hypothetical protein
MKRREIKNWERTQWRTQVDYIVIKKNLPTPRSLVHSRHHQTIPQKYILYIVISAFAKEVPSHFTGTLKSRKK